MFGEGLRASSRKPELRQEERTEGEGNKGVGKIGSNALLKN